MAFLDFLVVDNRVEGQVGLDFFFMADPGDFGQIFHLEVECGSGSHIEFPDTEIDGIGSGLDGGMQGGVGTHRSHDFYGLFFLYHLVLFLADTIFVGFGLVLASKRG